MEPGLLEGPVDQADPPVADDPANVAVHVGHQHAMMIRVTDEQSATGRVGEHFAGEFEHAGREWLFRG